MNEDGEIETPQFQFLPENPVNSKCVKADDSCPTGAIDSYGFLTNKEVVDFPHTAYTGP